MTKKFLFKNLFYVIVFCLLMSFFVALRCFQLCFLTNIETGICYEFKIFDFYFIIIALSFLIFSFLFFRFIRKPLIEDLCCVKRNKFLGVVSLLVSIVVFISSFFMVFENGSDSLVVVPFKWLFFITGIFFGISLIFLFACLIIGLDYCKLSLILVFCSSFVWTVVRLFNNIFTASFLNYKEIEYKFSISGLVFIFAFFYYFGRLVLNYNSLHSGCYFLTFGFSSVFIIFASFVPKLILNFYCWFGYFKFHGLFFNINIDLFNFYNFNLVDFIISLFVLWFSVYFIFNNTSKNNMKLN